MQGIEKDYGSVCVGALISAWRSLMEATAAEVLDKSRYGSRKGKSDTLGLDAKPEICIVSRIKDHDAHALIVTEEEGQQEMLKKRWPTDSKPERQPLMFFSDPTDRSSQFAKFIGELATERKLEKVGVLMDRVDLIAMWEHMFEPPASITGATTSITCVRKGALVFSAILNYITRVIYLAAPSGIYCYNLPPYSDSESLDDIDFDTIVKDGSRMEFLRAKDFCTNPEDAFRFATYLGSKSKIGYQENFNDSKILLDESNKFVHHRQPGGPSRVLYLSKLQEGFGPVGFILANGEKIGEWIHWLAFARFATNRQGGRALSVFEIAIERPWTKDGVLMSTSPPYSIFCSDDDGCTYLDISRLRNFDNPSKFRSMLVVMPFDNERMIYKMREHTCREIVL